MATNNTTPLPRATNDELKSVASTIKPVAANKIAFIVLDIAILLSIQHMMSTETGLSRMFKVYRVELRNCIRLYFSILTLSMTLIFTMGWSENLFQI